MSSYLITGSARGLGQELVRQLVSNPSTSSSTIFATARSPSPPAALQDLVKSSNGRVHFVQLDVTDDKSVASAVEQVTQKVGEKGLDVLINNAGIMSTETGGPSGWNALESTLTTNVVSVHKVTSAFLPVLTIGKEKKIVNISSTLGSVAMKDNFAQSPTASYKISKAALNMLTAQYSMELGGKGFTVFALSPGWLRTELGGQYADLETETGAKASLDVILGATAKDNGAFRNIHVPGHPNYDGTNPPW